jgi:hypothetical protein
MKNLFCVILITLAVQGRGQIKLMGMAFNTATNEMDLIQWNLFDEASVSATPTNLDNYLYASSSYDPFNGTYYIAGTSGATSGLYSYNTDSGESNLASGALYTNIAEFDMSTSKMYNLIM